MNMREEFEKWMSNCLGPFMDISRDDDGVYEWQDVRLAWLAWQAAQPKWIKCCEQMPPVDTIVVVSFKSLETSPLLWSGNEWDDEYGMIPIRQDVTHWMPLPNPPEE